MRVTDDAKRPYERADSPVSTLYSVNQLGPPAPSTTILRAAPSNDLKCWWYFGGTFMPGAAVMSKLDSSCNRMMWGSFPPGLHIAAGAFNLSDTDASDSSSPCVMNS